MKKQVLSIWNFACSTSMDNSKASADSSKI